jgi:hypothetical protein
MTETNHQYDSAQLSALATRATWGDPVAQRIILESLAEVAYHCDWYVLVDAIRDAQRSPRTQPARLETEQHLLLGYVGEYRLHEVARLIDQIEGKVAAVFEVPRNEPLINDRMTWFISPHARVRWSMGDAYACLLPSESNEEASLEGMIAEQLAGAFIDSYALGKLPSWLTQGASWAVVSRVEGKDPRVATWNQAIVPALQAMSDPDDFLTGQLLPDQAAVLNYSFAKFLMSDGTRFKRLLTLVREGTAFNAAFQQVYNGDPKALAVVWASTAASTD